LAVGYVLGSRAGREKYEQIVAATRKAQGHPAVTQAREKAKALLSTGTSASATPPPALAPTTPMPRPPRRAGTTTTADPLT
jgi:hypothetical protein